MFKKLIKFLFQTPSSDKKLVLKDMFFTNNNENIVRAIKLAGKLNQEELHNSIIIDIGAFNGETTTIFRNAFPTSRILAFEADPESAENLREKFIHDSNIEVHPYPLSSQREKMTFHVTQNKVSSSLNTIDPLNVNEDDYKNELNILKKIEVESRTLDEFTSNKPVALLKIDTQGHELHVLEGAKETLKATRFVLIEMANHNLYTNGCKYFEVDEWLRNHKFKLADIIVTYRKQGLRISEYDALYENTALNH